MRAVRMMAAFGVKMLALQCNVAESWTARCSMLAYNEQVAHQANMLHRNVHAPHAFWLQQATCRQRW